MRSSKPGWVYILLCSDNSYYTGSTMNLRRRMEEHRKGKDPNSYTASRLPVKLVYSKYYPTVQEAFRVEHQIKKWSRAKKEALIKGDFKLLHKLAECKNESHYKNARKRDHD